MLYSVPLKETNMSSLIKYVSCGEKKNVPQFLATIALSYALTLKGVSVMIFENLSGFGPQDSHDSLQNAQQRRHFGD